VFLFSLNVFVVLPLSSLGLSLHVANSILGVIIRWIYPLATSEIVGPLGLSAEAPKFAASGLKTLSSSGYIMNDRVVAVDQFAAPCVLCPVRSAVFNCDTTISLSQKVFVHDAQVFYVCVETRDSLKVK
jgi:hypothetical protein